MRGLIISEKVVDSDCDRLEGNFYQQVRVVVPKAGNLVITEYRGNVIAFKLDAAPKGKKVLRKVDVPDDLVLAAKQFVRAKIELYGMKDVLNALMGEDKK